MKVKVVLFILLASLVSLAQDKSTPLTVTNVKMWAKTDSSPFHLDPEVRYQNTSDKEIVIAVFELTYRDKLDRVTDVTLTEPVKVNACGHRTLLPGKKCGIFFGYNILHPDDNVTARVTIVKFGDGTMWEAAKSGAVNDRPTP